MGCATVTYDAPLKKYLMCVTDGWPTCAKMNSYILEADAITGPWRLVVYMKDFGEQGYFLNFPSKFISPDGKTLWLCYSANFAPNWNGMKLKINPPGGRYGLCLHEVQLLGPGAGVHGTRDGHSRPTGRGRLAARLVVFAFLGLFCGARLAPPALGLSRFCTSVSIFPNAASCRWTVTSRACTIRLAV